MFSAASRHHKLGAAHQSQTVVFTESVELIHNRPLFLFFSFSSKCRIESGVILSLRQQHKHPLHATAPMACHMTDTRDVFFFPPAFVFQNEYTSLIYVPARLKAVNRLHIICFHPQPADCSPCRKCITYPKISIFRAEVAAINGLISERMNKERRTNDPICIHTCPKFAFLL